MGLITLEKTKKGLTVVALLSFFVSLILTENYRNITVIAFALLIVLGVISQKTYDKKRIRLLVVNTLFFFSILISLSYSSNKELGLYRVTTMLGMLIFPLGFFFIKKEYYKKIEKYFYLVFFISTILFFIGVFVHNYFNDFLNENIFRNYAERLNSKYGKYSIHPIYASLYVSIAIFFSIRLIERSKTKWMSFLYILGDVFLAFILFLLARKGAIFFTAGIVFFYFFYKKNKKGILITSILLIGLLALIGFTEAIRARFIEMFIALVDGENTNKGSTFFRFEVFKCTKELINESFFFGYGIGDTKSLLKSCYMEKDAIFNGRYYNTHNQFLGAWISGGILSIGSLIYMLFINLKLAIRKSNFIYLAIVLFFFLVLLIENILERQNGVLLFSFFINFFAFKTLEELNNE